MPRAKSKLNNASSEVIAENFLKETPEMLQDNSDKIVVAKAMPELEWIEFRNDRDPGVPLEFHYASSTHPLHHYKLLHGEKYQLPLEVIDHLESRAVPIYGERKGLGGIPEQYVVSYKYQFSCRKVRQTA